MYPEDPHKVFALFKKLPPEVRCQIWQESMSEPRIVPIWYDAATTSYRPRTRPPGILQATHESRHEALKVYHELRLGLTTNTGCYIDPLRDAIYLRTSLTRVSNRFDDIANIEPWQRGRLITTSPVSAESSLVSTQTSTEDNQARSSDPSDVDVRSDVEIRNFPIANPDLHRSRRHSKVILDDLIHSPDREMIFKSFHVNYGTWDLIRRYYRHRRHKIPIRLKELCLVYENGTAPLKAGFEMREIGSQAFVAEGDPARPADYEERRQASKMVSSLSASNSFVNHRDRKQGRPIALNYRIYAKMVDTGVLSFGETASETGWLARHGLA
ncbi:hypothetical protein EG329_007163 [Mollisiaceae sp. DMI_Dod_QoI]|nr:hypothetical protein EG329_007163 [Helotiales sp. DMI_Dod_QoI]